MIFSIPGLYPLDASSTLPPVVTTKNASRHCQMSPSWEGGKISPWWELLIQHLLINGHYFQQSESYPLFKAQPKPYLLFKTFFGSPRQVYLFLWTLIDIAKMLTFNVIYHRYLLHMYCLISVASFSSGRQRPDLIYSWPPSSSLPPSNDCLASSRHLVNIRWWEV